jgi:hypothetical protein
MRFDCDEPGAKAGAAWDAFVRDDAAAAARPELERRVFAAVHAAAVRRGSASASSLPQPC